MPAPLAGKRVLDLGALCTQRPHALAISLAARLCALYGAAVHRPVPDGGEPLAHAEPRLPDGQSALDAFLNEGKQGGSGAGFDVAIGDSATLAEHAGDVTVKVRLSVYGPGEDPPATELSLLALSGLLGIVGEPNGPPTRLAGHQLAYAAGLSACTGLLAALHAGGTETVDVSLFDVAVWLNWKSPASLLVLGSAPGRGNARNHWVTMPVADGHIALVYQDKDWPALCEMVGDPRLLEPRFTTAALRSENRPALLDVLGVWLSGRTRAEITQAAQKRRIPIGPVKFPAELLEDAQHRARGFLRADGTPNLPLGWDGQRVVPQGMSQEG